MAGARFPLPPGSVVGILGGGQLGRMLALAAARLGFDTAVLTPKSDAPDGRVAAELICAPYDDPAALKALHELSDVITFEFENVPARALEILAELGAEVAPAAPALACSQDRVDEKRFLNGAGVATVDWRPVDAAGDIRPAMAALGGGPVLLKSRREGYDGKGQVWIASPAEAEGAFAAIGARPAILEARAAFRRELSVIAARGRDGAFAAYPIGENRHEGGILRTTRAPAPEAASLQAPAEAIARTLLDRLDYVGVLGVELFELESGRLLVNEIAPRVHNSGHWTQDGCLCDQFEQHIRAVAGWPLGPTRARAEILMENLIGDEAERWLEIAAEPDARLHLYGKGEARSGRKMGHVNRIVRGLTGG